jgi:hypothetical protein
LALLDEKQQQRKRTVLGFLLLPLRVRVLRQKKRKKREHMMPLFLQDRNYLIR